MRRAEATLLAQAETGQRKVYVSEAVHPHTRAVIDTYLSGLHGKSIVVKTPGGMTDEPSIAERMKGKPACLVVSQPNVFGQIEDIETLARTAHERGALLIVSADPIVQRYPNFASAEVCAWLIERSRGKLSRALVYDPGTGNDIADASRTNTAAGFNLAETDLVHVALQTKMSACCKLPINHMEGATVLHYEAGEEIADHFDFVDPAIPGYEREIAEHGERLVTFLVYLNDDYGGGETDFPRIGVRHKGHTGEGLFFVNALPGGGPDVRMLHAGCPPSRGEKWIVSQFVRDRPALRV